MYTLKEIKDAIDKAHNPLLVQRTESPNGNIIYHLYDNGEISFQKGGWAYLQRSEFTDKQGLCKKNYVDLFPNKFNSRSYAIISEMDAYNILNMMQIYDANI